MLLAGGRNARDRQGALGKGAAAGSYQRNLSPPGRYHLTHAQGVQEVSGMRFWNLGSLVMLAAAASFVGALSCGEDDTELLLDDATMVAALTEGEGESLDGAPSGEVEAAAEEELSGESGEANLSQACGFDALREQVRASYDVDGDGQLDESERQALAADLGEQQQQRQRWARQHRLQRLQWLYDADNSGALSEQERQQARADLDERCANRQAYLRERFDADSDGVLSAGEWEAARLELQARIQARHQEQLALYDSNHNGQLDAAEQGTQLQARRQAMEQRREQLRAQFDADSSGTLDEQEQTALRNHLRERVRGEHFAAEETF